MGPARVAISRSKATLLIEWQNGLLSEYSFSKLRAACPCAECQDAHRGMQEPETQDMLSIPLVDDRSTKLDRAEMVGNYAFQLYWMDGHSYGIYSWGYLRELSPPKEKEAKGE